MDRRPWGDGSGRQADDVRPDHAFSSTYACLRCVHCVAFSENKRVIDGKVATIEAAATGGSSPAARTSAAAKLQAYKAALKTATDATRGRA